jgi:hypothetical protein
MRRTSVGAEVLFLALVSACASNHSAPDPTQQAATTADPQKLEEIKLNVENIALVPSGQSRLPSDDRVVCIKENRTNSYLPSNRCRTKRQRSEESDRAQEWMRSGGEFGSVNVLNN